MDHASRLGELLVREGRITLEQLQEAQEEQRRSRTNLTAALLKLGYIDAREITTTCINQEYRLPSIELDKVELDPAMRELAPREVMERLRFVPLSFAGNCVIVAIPREAEAGFNDVYLTIERDFLGGRRTEPVTCDDDALDRAIARLFAEG